MPHTYNEGPLLHGADDFCWAVGIEDTFIPQSRPGMRALEEYTLTQHYDLWETDLALAAQLGVRAIRWGIPWYRVEPEPGRFDWSWTDRLLESLVNRHHLVPILDLMHYGTPLWLDNSFINNSYPQRVAAYAEQVARRYQGLVQVFTPLNEPMVNVDFCGRRGEWPPYLSGEDGYFKLLLAVARGIVLTVEALRTEQPGCTLVQVEALWHFWTHDPAHIAAVAADNQRQYLCFDLCTGRVGQDHPLLPAMLAHGVTPANLDWFAQHKVSFDIFGANFYPWSYGELAVNQAGKLRRTRKPTPGGAIAEVITEAHQHSGLPVMVTETSAKAPIPDRARWMDETIAAVRQLRAAGTPVVGYTWFPMFTMIDWAYRTGRRPLADYLLHLGLYESHFDPSGILRREPTELVERFKAAVGLSWRDNR